MSILTAPRDAKITAVTPQQAKLSGRLDRLVGKELLTQGRRLIAASGKQWQVDLAEVNHSSSVGIALLLDWLRYAKRKNVKIEFLFFANGTIERLKTLNGSGHSCTSSV